MSGEKKITGIFFGKTEPPCVPDCERRCAGCHSTCQKYKDWKSKADADRERRNELNRAKQEVNLRDIFTARIICNGVILLEVKEVKE